MQKIKVLGDSLVFDGKFIKVLRRDFIGSDGKPGMWEMVRRKTLGRIIAVAAITPEKEILLEKIFRIPLNDYILELPAGLMDVANEDEIEVAKRELLEETGYAAESVEFLTSGHFNAGLLGDELAIYFAQDVRYVAEPKLEGAEDIEIIKVPLAKLFDYLTDRKDMKVDIKTAAIIPHLMKRGLM